MLFNSIDFLIFFPIVVLIYFFIPKKIRYIWLLITSYYFYMGWNPKYALLIALSTFITYISSIVIHKYAENKWVPKLSLIGSLVSNLGILVVFKYANFILDNISNVMSHVGLTGIDRRLDLLLPVGISFYTFQALSYTIDVYKQRIEPERNILKYALFVSFFPQLVAGPIERSEHLLTQIQNTHSIKLFEYERVRDGILLMLWGLFQKLVIADRASILVNQVINNYNQYGVVEIAIAAVFFATQIYCDFGGYTNIARGAAKVMGFDLMNNFEQPYLATSIKDFWRRWHISLTTWFTDYVYIPLGGNRKGTLRKYINILIVFAISGLWHGASWNFIVWGLLHAIYQIVENIAIKKKDMNQVSIAEKIFNMLVTFVLVDFAWLFFVSSNLNHALNVIKQMFTHYQTPKLLEIGFTYGDWICLIVGCLIMLMVDIIHEKKLSIYGCVNRLMLPARIIIYWGLMWSIIIFGIYGVNYDASTFIYFQF